MAQTSVIANFAILLPVFYNIAGFKDSAFKRKVLTSCRDSPAHWSDRRGTGRTLFLFAPLKSKTPLFPCFYSERFGRIFLITKINICFIEQISLVYAPRLRDFERPDGLFTALYPILFKNSIIY
jgi:hypothetical protein